MAERGFAIRADISKQGWEKSDFPILCETCLGENPYLRMSKSEFSRECKVCQRPFTVFRWKPGSSARYKKTEICQTCAKLKNVCQTCLFDLDFGLPVELRDKFIDQQELISMPKDVANKDYWANNMNAKIEDLDLPYQNPQVKEALSKISEQHNIGSITGGKSYKRNAPHVCTFFVNGKCTRGKECPYRHTNITEQDLESLKKGGGSVDDKIRDRFNGINDPIATKILDKIKDIKVPESPEDQNITTVFVGGKIHDIDEQKLRQKFEPFGKVKAVKLIPKKHCAFVCFFARDAAEKAFKALYERLYIDNKKFKVLWAKAQLDENQSKKHKSEKNNLEETKEQGTEKGQAKNVEQAKDTKAEQEEIVYPSLINKSGKIQPSKENEGSDNQLK